MSEVLWFTGLSGAGKSTLSHRLSEDLSKRGFRVRLWDGDSIRREFTQKLGFTREDILKNNEFILQLCLKDLGAYDFILVAAISPFEESRKNNRASLKDQYHEIHMSASIETLAKRDVKGLYKKALAGEIENFIGIAKEVPYETPTQPNLTLETNRAEPEQSYQLLMNYLQPLLKNASSRSAQN